MRNYEHTFIARQDLSPQQAQGLAETYAGVVAEQGGEVTKNEYWGLRSLSYRIKKNRKGHYIHFNLNASSAAIDELERQQRLSDDVLRYLTVRVDDLEEGPSVLMQARSSREERSRRTHDDGPRRSHDDGPRRSHDDGPRRARSDDDTKRTDEAKKSDEAQKPDEAPKSSEAEKVTEAKTSDAAKPSDEAKTPDEAKTSDAAKTSDEAKPSDETNTAAASEPTAKTD